MNMFRLRFTTDVVADQAESWNRDSIRRSGTRHIRATITQMASAIHSRTKANGIAAAYSTGEILPLRSRPSAVASFEPGPCYSSNGAFIR